MASPSTNPYQYDTQQAQPYDYDEEQAKKNAQATGSFAQPSSSGALPSPSPQGAPSVPSTPSQPTQTPAQFTASQSGSAPTAQQPTFAELQSSGQARPPMPVPPANIDPMATGGGISPLAPPSGLSTAAAGYMQDPTQGSGPNIQYPGLQGLTPPPASSPYNLNTPFSASDPYGVNQGKSLAQQNGYDPNSPTGGQPAGTYWDSATQSFKQNATSPTGPNIISTANGPVDLSTGQPVQMGAGQTVMTNGPQAGTIGQYDAQGNFIPGASVASTAQSYFPATPGVGGVTTNPQTFTQMYGSGPSSGGGGTLPGSPSSTTTGTNTPATSPTGTPDILSLLTGGVQGQGAGSQVQNATQQAILKQLQNPSPYGSQQVQDAYKWLGGNIDDQYSVQRQQLGEQMARRGLGASTIYGGRLNDLNIGQRTAKDTLAENLGQNLAQTLGQYQQGAINSGITGGTTAQQNQQNWLSQLMGYGQQGFNNDLATNQANQNQQNTYQNYILQLLGLGYSPTG